MRVDAHCDAHTVVVVLRTTSRTVKLSSRNFSSTTFVRQMTPNYGTVAYFTTVSRS